VVWLGTRFGWTCVRCSDAALSSLFLSSRCVRLRVCVCGMAWHGMAWARFTTCSPFRSALPTFFSLFSFRWLVGSLSTYTPGIPTSRSYSCSCFIVVFPTPFDAVQFGSIQFGSVHIIPPPFSSPPFAFREEIISLSVLFIHIPSPLYLLARRCRCRCLCLWLCTCTWLVLRRRLVRFFFFFFLSPLLRAVRRVGDGVSVGLFYLVLVLVWGGGGGGGEEM
jgi:hypothetical protein